VARKKNTAATQSSGGVVALFDTIIKRSGEVIPFEKEKIAHAIYKAAVAVGGHDHGIADSLVEKVVLLLNQSFTKEDVPTVEDIQDHVEKVLIEEGHARTAKAYILYRAERRRMRESGKNPFTQGEVIPYKVLWRVLNWNLDRGVHTVDGLNACIRTGKFQQLVRDADQAYHEDISGAASAILERKGKVRVVIVAGPSSSGKTTTTTKLAARLKAEAGWEFAALNLDNYFFNLERHPKDEFGDYDFETPAALDLKLINQHLDLLLAGKQIQMPRYNFKTGLREAETTPFRIAPNQIILLDSLHGLYQEMTDSVPSELKFKLYIETLSQLRDAPDHYIRWTDTRLLRRMSRDRLFRAYNPKETLGHWHYVRKAELRHIIPFLPTVDYVVNGALPYELPVLKSILYPYFPDMLREFEGNPKRQDAWIRGKRVFDLLSAIDTVSEHDCIPGDSLLREFIGGSTLKY
jgi:uridine kinase